MKYKTKELVEEYLNSRKVNLKQYSFSILKNVIDKHFLIFFNDIDLNKLTPKIINDYYLYIANLNLKPKTKNNIISSVLVLIDWLDIMELIPSNINKKFKQILKCFPLIEEPKNDYLNNDEIKKLLNSIETNNIEEKREKLMIEVFIFSGVRKSELRGLTFDDVDINNSTLLINKQIQTITSNGKTSDVLVNYTKTNRNRMINIPKFLLKEILKYKKEYLSYIKINNIEYDEYIFPYKVVRINRILDKHLKNANIKHIKVHDLRHTYCTMLYDNGCDSKFVQKQMGHKSDRTSRDIYEHFTNKMESKGIEIINKICRL